jgi:two-component system OmpR family response regulator
MPLRRRILVAEDDHDVRELIRTRLASAGYEVHTARNGAEALVRIAAVKPHGMVLDINMPELDGFGVLEALRAQGAAIPVLVLTARHAADDVRRAISLGAKDYLTKPFSEAQLQARVARLMRAMAAVPAIVTLLDD